MHISRTVLRPALAACAAALVASAMVASGSSAWADTAGLVVSMPTTVPGDPGVLVVDVSSDDAVNHVTAQLVSNNVLPPVEQTVDSFHLVSGDATSGEWQSDRVDLSAYDDYAYTVTATDAGGASATTAPTTLGYWPRPVPHDIAVSPTAVDYAHPTVTATGQLDEFDPRSGDESAWSGQAVRLTSQASGVDVATDDGGNFTASYVPLQAITDGALDVTLSARVNNGAIVKVENFDATTVSASVSPTRLTVDPLPTLDAGESFQVTGHAEYELDGSWLPLPDAAIYADGPETWTGQDGAFTLNEQAPELSIDPLVELYLEGTSGGPYLTYTNVPMPWTIRPSTELSFQGFAVSLTSKVHVTSGLYDDGGNQYLAARKILLEQSVNGINGWTTAATLTTDSTGHLDSDVAVAHPHYFFRLHFAGDQSYQPSYTQAFEGTRTDTSISANAGPEPAHKGKHLTVVGTLERQPGNGAWVALGHERINYYFRAPGSTTFRYVGESTADSGGHFSRTFTATSSGYWSARWTTTSTGYVDATSAEDYVHVVR